MTYILKLILLFYFWMSVFHCQPAFTWYFSQNLTCDEILRRILTAVLFFVDAVLSFDEMANQFNLDYFDLYFSKSLTPDKIPRKKLTANLCFVDAECESCEENWLFFEQRTEKVAVLWCWTEDCIAQYSGWWSRSVVASCHGLLLSELKDFSSRLLLAM